MTQSGGIPSQQQVTPAGVAVGLILALGLGYIYRRQVFHTTGMWSQGPRKGRGRKR